MSANCDDETSSIDEVLASDARLFSLKCDLIKNLHSHILCFFGS